MNWTLRNALGYLRWSYLFRTDKLVVVAHSALKINRLIGLIPRIVYRTEDGSCRVEDSPASVWYMYAAFLGLHGLSAGATFFRIAEARPASVFVVYYSMRIVIAAAIHIRALVNYREIHESFKDFYILDAQVPVYWIVVTYALTLSALTFACIRQLMDTQSVKIGLLRTAGDVLPSLVVACSSCQIMSKVDAVRNKLNDLNQNISVFLVNARNSQPFDFRSILASHVKIRVVCSCLNEVYGDIMFLLTFYVFVDLSFAIFGCLMTDWTPGHAVYLIKSVMNSIPSLTLMYAAQETESAFQKTNYFTDELKKLADDVKTDFSEQVNEWKIQLIQLPIYINALECFKLNRQLIRTVISTIITYTVILLQNVKRSW